MQASLETGQRTPMWRRLAILQQLLHFCKLCIKLRCKLFWPLLPVASPRPP
jgi:hypothetical protein